MKSALAVAIAVAAAFAPAAQAAPVHHTTGKGSHVKHHSVKAKAAGPRCTRAGAC